MEEDRLVEIPRSDWEEWRDLYKRDWPRHEIGFNVVQNYIDWSKHDRKIKDLVLYSLNGSWRENGTFVIIVSIRTAQVLGYYWVQRVLRSVLSCLLAVELKKTLKKGSQLFAHIHAGRVFGYTTPRSRTG